MNLKNKENFSKKFIEKYLEYGFGSTTKRELDIYILYLLINDGQFKNKDNELDYHKMSLELKLTEAKVRNLVYEVTLKYLTNINFTEELLKLIENERFDIVSGDTIRFSIHNPLIKQTFEHEVRKLNGVSDGSFSKHIVSINKDIFKKLLSAHYVESGKVDKLIEGLPGDISNNLNENRGDLVGIFVEEFVSNFASTSGDKAAKLLFEIVNPIDFFKGIFNQD
jgi:hypothetical protein